LPGSRSLEVCFQRERTAGPRRPSLLAGEVEKEFREAGVSVIDLFLRGTAKVDEEFCRARGESSVCGSAGLPRRCLLRLQCACLTQVANAPEHHAGRVVEVDFLFGRRLS
jgi:hypothetical protein